MLGLGSAFERLSQNMQWNLPLSETIKKRAIRYLLQRYVGQFLLETLSLDQLSVDLTNGTGIIKDLSLDINSLNEVAEQLNLPFQFIDGYIGEIMVNIPWRNLFNENCFVCISGLKLVLRPKQRDAEVSLVDSMIDSMSTSMQIAQECLSQVTQVDSDYGKSEEKEKDFESNSAIDGIEIFAKIIDTILNKIKVRFTDTIIRLEYVPKLGQSGVALDIKIKKIDYYDEAGFKKEKEPFVPVPVPNPEDPKKDHLVPASFTSKKFLIDGISIYTNEFIPQQECETDSYEPHSFQTEIHKSLDIDIPENRFNDSWNEDSNNFKSFINHDKSHFVDSSPPPITSILMAKISGRQEIVLKLRKHDTVAGPKVHFETNFDRLITFLSPRQVHMLIELAEGISAPENIDSNNLVFLDGKTNLNNIQKPMSQNDFKKIERELMQNITPPHHVTSHCLSNHEGWSSPPELNDDEFHPIYSERSKQNMTSSTMTDMSDFDTSYSSTISSHANASNGNGKKVNDLLTDFKIKINSLCIVILHEDILIPSTDLNEIVTTSSINEMARKAENFFASIGETFHYVHSYVEYLDLQTKVEKACTLSHLRFIITALASEGQETIFLNKWELKGTISAGWSEIVESINDSVTDTPKMIYNKLLTFKDELYNSTDGKYKPKFQLAFKQSQNIKITGRSRRMSTPKSDIRVSLDECIIEVDLSLVDRINTLLNKQDVILKYEEPIPSDRLPPSHLDNQAFFKEIMEETQKTDTKTRLTVTSPNVNIKLYFPIPDLRPSSDMNKVPWWKRNVRDAILVTKIEDFYLEAFFSSSCPNTFEILSNDIHILFQENKDLPLVSLIRASNSKDNKGFNPVRIVIHNYPSKLYSSLEDEPTYEHENLMTKSMMGCLEENMDTAPNIFNKRNVASSQQKNVTELNIPANISEMKRFMNDTLKNVQFEVEISLSDAQLILPSKHIYEVVYNRFVSDLLLWTPSAPLICNRTRNSLSCAMEDLSIGTTLIKDKYYNSTTSEFKAFESLKKKGTHNEEGENGYTSTYDENFDIDQKHGVTRTPNDQTLIGLRIDIMNATGSIHTPFRDHENKIIPGKYGDVSFNLETGFMFIASGYKGNRDSCHGCLSVQKINVYHKENNQSPVSPIYLVPNTPLLTRKMDAVLYPCDSITGMGASIDPTKEQKDSLLVCFKMDYDLVKNENVFELAGGMFGLTTRHFMTSPSESWVFQLGDMFNVEDYPVEGYSLPEVISQITFHFEYCGIDYRPLHLPLKSYITVDSLAVSSNLEVEGSSSVLLVVIEDAGCFLSKNLSCQNVELKNYVCIADLGFFEFCMKLHDDSLDIPIQEILFFNNMIHLRTCSDSFKAFLELLIYLANNGDLIQEPDNLKLQKEKSVLSKPSNAEKNICSPNAENTINCHNLVKNLMQDAMVEPRLPNKKVSVKNEGYLKEDLFLFPDENKRKEMSHKNEGKTKELDTEFALQEALEEDFFENDPVASDEEFCILDLLPGTGIGSPTGKPTVKHLEFEHVNIKENHFNAEKDYSQEARLNSPDHSLRPQTQYNLHELSITWHMFGGSDFSEVDENDKNGNHKVQINSKSKDSPYSSPQTSTKSKQRHAVTFLNNEPSILSDRSSPVSFHSPSNKTNANLKWFEKGGPNRHYTTMMEIFLSKIRFKYDVYPAECSLEFRHVLTINDIEIRDKLATSQINKFLYQFSSESNPKQASSNMVQVKALTKRNEPSVNSSETNLNISIRPIRLNIDQDALIFLTTFIEDLKSIDNEMEYGEEEKPSVNFTHPPVLTVNHDYYNFEKGLRDKELVEEVKLNVDTDSSPIYFRNVVFSPDVPIRIDYHGKHIDINSQYGALVGLIIGLGQLDHSEITLKRVEFKSGVLGVNKLVNSLTNEWIYDIKKNQLPSILRGVGPMNSFVNLFCGLKDLFWLPVEQYNKDGRVFRGLQKGTSSFTSSSAYAVLDLTGRFVGCIQSTAETMYDMVSSGPSVRNRSYKTKRGQPKDIREGVTTAFGLVRNGLGDTANTLIKVASEEHSHKGVSGALGGVLRQIPSSVVQPIIIASEATCTVLGGLTNQLVPDARKEAADKWKV